MSEESIFDEVVLEPQEAPAPTLQIPTEVAELVGEGKKYKSVEEALRSVPHAQSHIQKLEEEMQAVKEELMKRKAAEELLEDFKSASKQEVTPQAPLDKDTLASMVEQTLSQREAKQRASANVQQVVNSFNEKFGEKGPEMYKKIAEENGLSLSFLNSVAASSPAAVLKLAGMSSSPAPAAGKTTSSVNTQAMQSNSQQHVPSSRVPKGASTRDLVNAWKAAGEKVKQQSN